MPGGNGQQRKGRNYRALADDEKDRLKQLIAYEGAALNDWERQFIDDMAERLEKIGEFSQRQREIIDKIHGEVMTDDDTVDNAVVDKVEKDRPDAEDEIPF